MAGGIDKPGNELPVLPPTDTTKPPPGSIAEGEQKLNPTNPNDAKNLEEAFGMSVFNIAATLTGQANNRFKEILEDSNKQEQRRKMIMGMVKSGLT